MGRVRVGDVHDRGSFKIWMVILLVLSFIYSDLTLTNSVEAMKRDQARYNLQQVKHCYIANIEVMTQKMAFDACTNKSKTSFTGDVYILNADTLKFVHETSRDVPRDGDLYFTKESVGQYFKDWESANRAIKIMQLGKDSEAGVNNSYNFDGDVEWLEWIYLPNEFGDLDGKRLIAVQGTQKDEVMNYFSYYRYGCMVMTAFMSFLLLVAQSRRRKNERR